MRHANRDVLVQDGLASRRAEWCSGCKRNRNFDSWPGFMTGHRGMDTEMTLEVEKSKERRIP